MRADIIKHMVAGRVGWSALADHVGVSTGTTSRWLHDLSSPPTELADKLVDFVVPLPERASAKAGLMLQKGRR